MSFKKSVGRWLGHAANAAAFWPFVPSGMLAVIGAFLSQSVSWIAALGAFGWFLTGITVFFVSASSFAIIARTKLWRIEAKRQARLQGESSPFDPMAPVYEGKRLYLRDLAPLGRRTVANKRFINCEIIGPGVAMIGMQTDATKPSLVRNSRTLDGVDVFEIDPSRESQQAIKFWDCDFDGCHFYHMSLLFVARENESLYWMTKDARQALLPDDGGTLASFSNQQRGEGT